MRTEGVPEEAINDVRRVIQAIDPDLPVSGVRSMTSHLEQDNAFIVFRIAATSSAFFGVLGVLLASIGLYGVVSYDLSQRSHEIGVRMALGASALDILHDVLKRGATFAMMGVAVGVVLAIAVGQLLRRLFLGVSPLDPLSYGIVVLLLVATCVFASFVPARRATATDPLEALRAD